MPAERWEALGWSPIGEAPYGEFMQIRIMDSWVHEQDIRWAIDRPGDRGGRGEAVALAGSPRVWGSSSGGRSARPTGTTVAVRLEGPLARELAHRRARAPGQCPRRRARRRRRSGSACRPSTSSGSPAAGRPPRRSSTPATSGVEGDEELGEQIVASMNFMI